MPCGFCCGAGWCWAWSWHVCGWQREACPDCEGEGEVPDPWVLWVDLGGEGGG